MTEAKPIEKARAAIATAQSAIRKAQSAMAAVPCRVGAGSEFQKMDVALNNSRALLYLAEGHRQRINVTTPPWESMLANHTRDETLADTFAARYAPISMETAWDMVKSWRAKFPGMRHPWDEKGTPS